MTKKLTGIFAVCISLLCTACGAYWEETGMFSEIENEIKLEKPDVIGNIMSILEYNGELFAGGGVIYHKNINAVRGWSKFSDSPYGQVIRLAAGYSGGTEWLYALCAGRKTDGTEEIRLYARNPGSGWTQVPVSGTITTIFSNNAVSAGGAANNNRAFVTTSTGIFELQGGGTPIGVSATDTTNGALAASKSAAYYSTQTHFSNDVAFASDGTNHFTATEVSSVSDITSLWALGGTLYVGTLSGPKQVSYTSGSTLGAVSDIAGTNAGATFSGYANAAVYARLSGGRKDVYLSAIGRGSTFASKNNGLWGYYSDKNNWNRE